MDEILSLDSTALTLSSLSCNLLTLTSNYRLLYLYWYIVLNIALRSADIWIWISSIKPAAAKMLFLLSSFHPYPLSPNNNNHNPNQARALPNYKHSHSKRKATATATATATAPGAPNNKKRNQLIPSVENLLIPKSGKRNSYKNSLLNSGNCIRPLLAPLNPFPSHPMIMIMIM